MELDALGAAPLRATARAGHLRVMDFGWLGLAATLFVTQTGSTTLASAGAGNTTAERIPMTAAASSVLLTDRPFTSSEPNIGRVVSAIRFMRNLRVSGCRERRVAWGAW